MTTYLLISLAFTIVYYFRYLREVVFDVEAACVVLELDFKEGFNVITYSVISSLFCSVLMPLFAFYVTTDTRDNIVKDRVKDIMSIYFDQRNFK